MFKNLLCCLLAHQIFMAAASPISNAHDVVFVSVMYRHGNRTVIESYPNDPYKNESYWPEGFGQLTKAGMMGHYELGRWLRRRYDHILTPEYNLRDIYVLSTDTDRTLMSAYSNLAGLYQPTSNRNWNPHISWSPIPVHTTKKELDQILWMTYPCPKYNFLIGKLMSSDWYLKILKTNRRLLEFLTVATGMPVNNLVTVRNIHDALLIAKSHNYDLPSWTKLVFPEPMRDLADMSFTLACHTAELARLKTGPLVSEIVTNMVLKSKGVLDPDRKMFMYSAHDTTLSNLMQGLGAFNGRSPPYFSTLLIELRRSNDEYFVTILYKNGSDSVYPLMVPGCTTLCPLGRFQQLLEPIIPSDWEKECEMSVLEDINPVCALSIAAIFILLIFGAYFYLCRKSAVAYHRVRVAK